jgi:hypothetical protein
MACPQPPSRRRGSRMASLSVLETHRQVRLFTLRFDDEEVIYAEGLELACPAFLPELA